MSNTTNPSRRKQLLRAGLILLLVFLFGLAVGAGTSIWLVHSHFKSSLSSERSQPSALERLMQHLEQRLAREADLSSSEADKLHLRMNNLTNRLEESRGSAIDEARVAVNEEFSALLEEVEPERREPLRQAINKRLQRWGLPPLQESNK